MTRTMWCGLTVGGITLAALVTGCTTREPVMMYNSQTREIARCAEGYRSFIAGGGYRRQEDCIADYERQGYERMSPPGRDGAR